jgi:hypothetical protein
MLRHGTMDNKTDALELVEIIRETTDPEPDSTLDLAIQFLRDAIEALRVR